MEEDPLKTGLRPTGVELLPTIVVVVVVAVDVVNVAEGEEEEEAAATAAAAADKRSAVEGSEVGVGIGAVIEAGAIEPALMTPPAADGATEKECAKAARSSLGAIVSAT